MEYEQFKKVCTPYEMQMFDDYCRNRDVTGSNLGWHFKKWYALDWTARVTKEKIANGYVDMVDNTSTSNTVGVPKVRCQTCVESKLRKLLRTERNKNAVLAARVRELEGRE